MLTGLLDGRYKEELGPSQIGSYVWNWNISSQPEDNERLNQPGHTTCDKIFPPVLPTTCLFTLKHIAMMAVVRRIFAKLRDKNSPFPVAKGDAIQLGSGNTVLRRIAAKKTKMNKGKDFSARRIPTFLL